MDLTLLKGNIIGVVQEKIEKSEYQDKKVKEIIINKLDESLKVVNLDNSYIDKKFKELSIKEQNKVLLASQLQDKSIVLYDFSIGMLEKELVFYRNLFKKIKSYGKKIILVSNDADLFLGLVDNVYVINKKKIIYHTNDMFDLDLYKYIDIPKIIEFVKLSREKGIKLNYYVEINDLLKAIYRLKS